MLSAEERRALPKLSVNGKRCMAVTKIDWQDCREVEFMTLHGEQFREVHSAYEKGMADFRLVYPNGKVVPFVMTIDRAPRHLNYPDRLVLYR